MKTSHRILFEDSRHMEAVASESVDLVVTSPPYPMIEMWDETFAAQDPEIAKALKAGIGAEAFELMHGQLDSVWDEVCRVLRPGGIACINIGDATRTLDGDFFLYSNHARILRHFSNSGLSSLPLILWRKQTNAPNKFMGSGMLPPGAYVTLEHEYILVLRKGSRRKFHSDAEKARRRESAFFWEERNAWFSDIWFDLKGTTQNLNNGKTRGRSAAFPFELPYRLINMFSIKRDLVLDPFHGTGTTLFAAMASARNSIGYEVERGFKDEILEKMGTVVSFSNQGIRERIRAHIEFVKERQKTNGALKYVNKNYNFPIVTSQETDLLLNQLLSVEKTRDTDFEIVYSDKPQKEFCSNWEELIIPGEDNPSPKKSLKRKKSSINRQLSLLK
jgi:modification methylase